MCLDESGEEEVIYILDTKVTVSVQMIFPIIFPSVTPQSLVLPGSFGKLENSVSLAYVTYLSLVCQSEQTQLKKSPESLQIFGGKPTTKGFPKGNWILLNRGKRWVRGLLTLFSLQYLVFIRRAMILSLYFSSTL